MLPQFHFDVGSQYAASSVLCFVFGIAFFILSRRFREIGGIGYLGAGFFAAGIGLIVFLSRGPIPFILSVLLSNALIWAAMLLFYSGFVSLLSQPVRLFLPVSFAVVGLMALAFFCRGPYLPNNPPHIVARIVSLSVVDALIAACLLREVLRFPHRGWMTNSLTAFLGFGIAVNTARACAILYFGAYGNIFTWDPVQITFGLATLIAVCCLAILGVTLVGHRIAAILERTARLDALTSALNRRGIEELLAAELERARRTGTAFSIALADIDHFKTFNDIAGHPAGDRILQQVVDAIRSNLRPFDACGRLGGDEFMLLLPSASTHDAAQICERILQAVAALPPPSVAAPSPTLSIGFTQARATEAPAAVIARADRALYAAKQSGRNCAQSESAGSALLH